MHIGHPCLTVLCLLFHFTNPTIIHSSEQPAREKSTSEKSATEKNEAIRQTSMPLSKSVEKLIEKVKPSIVVVSFSGREGKTTGLGTGFVISQNGLIATNRHVIGEARPITVRFANGNSYPVESIHANDRHLDLAILKISAKNIPALTLGDSDTLKQGQPVIAMGNPEGLEHSVVSGIVSGRRKVNEQQYIQLAIPIERGNSGGPLLDEEGKVHGILTMKSLVTQNLGFAVPVNSLKPLIKTPNPIPMKRWMTIGTLDDQEWKIRYGGRWRQRAGQILASERGAGFGGRSLCFSQSKVPATPFEVSVQVKLDDESGAAGLIFHADGRDRHYGFYPSNGSLRLSRFEGPDVFSWKVLQQVQSRYYQQGEWNHLKVKVQPGKIQCYLNDHLVITSEDDVFSKGQVGLAKFRETKATFKQFRVGKTVPNHFPSANDTKQVLRHLENLLKENQNRQETFSALGDAFADPLLKANAEASRVLLVRARELELQAEQLRNLSRRIAIKQIQTELSTLLEKSETTEDKDQIDLLHCALLIAKLDNIDLDVESYLNEVKRMSLEVQKSFPENATEEQRLNALNLYLFEELGFHGSRHDYYNRSNSYLNEVIDDREGLPITLSVLYLDLARRLKVNVVGVGLPGHFIVRHEPKEGTAKLIDVFNRGEVLSKADAARKVKEITERAFEEDHLKTVDSPAILDRMLSNLIGIAQDDGDMEAMLRYIDTKVALDGKNVQNRLFRAVLRFQNELYEDALADTNWLLVRDLEELNLTQLLRLKDEIEKRLNQE